MRRQIRLMAAGLLAVAGLMPVAHAADSRATGWILTRAGGAAQPIEGHLAVSGTSSESAIVMFATNGTGAHRKLDGSFDTATIEWGVDGWAQVNDDSVQSAGCPAMCQNPVGVQENAYITSNGRKLTSTVYIAAYDVKDPTLTINPGWTVRKWLPNWQELTTSNAKGSTTVTTAHTSAGIYRGGHLTGGRNGSIVLAELPCDLHGQGSATLTGGTRARPMSCGYVTSIVDYSAKQTTWRVTGEVNGVGWSTGVLIVVDLPH